MLHYPTAPISGQNGQISGQWVPRFAAKIFAGYSMGMIQYLAAGYWGTTVIWFNLRVPYIISRFTRNPSCIIYQDKCLNGVTVCCCCCCLDVGKIGRFVLERLFPNFAETDCRVESVEDGQRHGHVGNDRPRPLAAIKSNLKNNCFFCLKQFRLSWANTKKY